MRHHLSAFEPGLTLYAVFLPEDRVCGDLIVMNVWGPPTHSLHVSMDQDPGQLKSKEQN